MSDLMLHGVLNMPVPDDPSELGFLEWAQIVGRMREASEVITTLRARVAELEAALEIIAGRRQCMDNLMGNRDVAIWALERNGTGTRT